MIDKCEYCKDGEDCPYLNDKKKCNAVFVGTDFDFFDYILDEDWVSLIKSEETIKKTAIQSIIDNFEDNIPVDKKLIELFEHEIKELNEKIVECMTNTEIKKVIVDFFNKNEIKHVFNLGQYQIPEVIKCWQKTKKK